MHFFRTVLWLVSLLSLVACGGGSGGGSGSSSSSLIYEGKTTQAILTKDQAKEFVSSAKNISLESVSSDVSDSNKISKSLLKQGKVTQGAKSGTVDFTRTTINKLTTKIVATFKNFSDDGLETLNGKVTYLITVDTEETSFIKKMDMSISLLTIKSKNTDITLDGSIIVIADDDGRNETFTQNTVVKNNSNDEVLKFENFITVVDDNGRDLSYAGKVFHSTNGYVVISTPVKLSYTDADTVPSMGGVISYEGKNSIVHERIAYEGRIRVEIDEGKDGTVDEFEVYDIRTLEVVPNTAPITTITFPKEIFTNTNSSEIKVVTYDPDLDDFTSSYEWQVNDVVKSSTLTLSNELFKKHDTLKLSVTAEDNRVGEKKKSIENKAQKVLNSRPLITSSFEDLAVVIGNTTELNYSIEDADDDIIEISWESWKTFEKEDIDNNTPNNCEMAINEYEMFHDHSYDSLTDYEQEDFNRSNCEDKQFYNPLSESFVKDHTFTAIFDGLYEHKMIVSDGDYNRSRSFISKITKMELIESEEHNYDNNFFVESSLYGMYMKDFNNDGNKDLIYVGSSVKIEKEDDFIEPNGNVIEGSEITIITPLLTIDYRNGKTLLDKKTYEIKHMSGYHLNDMNGDGKLDVLITYANSNDTSDNKTYGVMYQQPDGSLENIQKFSLANRNSLVIHNIIGDDSDDIVTMGTNNYSSNGKITIYTNDRNITIQSTLAKGKDTKLLIHDIDKNSKQDIIIVNKTYKSGESEDSEKLIFDCSILFQESNSSFTEKVYSIILEENMNIVDYPQIIDLQIVDVNNQKDIWMLSSTEKIYFLKLENNNFEVINSIKYKEDKRPIATNLVDINGDGKKDIVLIESSNAESNLVSVLIQTDNLKFISEQSYSFNDDSFSATSTALLGDIDNDGKYELFVNTGEEELSVLYFK